MQSLSIFLVLFTVFQTFNIPIANCFHGFNFSEGSKDLLPFKGSFSGPVTLEILTRKAKSMILNNGIYEPKHDVLRLHFLNNSTPSLTLALHRTFDHIGRRLRRHIGPYQNDIRSYDYTGTVSMGDGTLIGDASVSAGHGQPFGMAGIVKVGEEHFILQPLSETALFSFAGGYPSLKFQHELRPVHETAARGRCVVEKVPPHLQAEPVVVAKPVQMKAAEESIVQQKSSKTTKKTPKTTSRILELAVFSDKELYEIFKLRYPGNPLGNLTNYVLTNVNNMNYLYKDSSIGADNMIDIRLTHLEVMTTRSKTLNNGGGQESVFLPSFCKFAAKKNPKGTLWDHAVMLTGLDLKDKDSGGIIGVAYTAAMCETRYSCSLVEAFSFLGAFTMAHEMGHSLGMNHDGEENNKVCDPKRYIMAAIEGSGQTTWSSCSEKNLRDYLRGKSSIKGAAKPTCLTGSSKSKRRRPSFPYAKAKLPGEVYPAASQCVIALGVKSSRPVPPYFQMCQELYCSNGTLAYRTHPALEGTTCGESMWCKSGICVPKAGS